VVFHYQHPHRFLGQHDASRRSQPGHGYDGAVTCPTVELPASTIPATKGAHQMRWTSTYRRAGGAPTPLTGAGLPERERQPDLRHADRRPRLLDQQLGTPRKRRRLPRRHEPQQPPTSGATSAQAGRDLARAILLTRKGPGRAVRELQGPIRALGLPNTRSWAHLQATRCQNARTPPT
jgi:hypothetical protein